MTLLLHPIALFIALVNEFYVGNNIQNLTTKINIDIQRFTDLLLEAKDRTIDNLNDEITNLEIQLAAAKSKLAKKDIKSSLAVSSSNNNAKLNKNTLFNNDTETETKQALLSHASSPKLNTLDK